MKTRNELIEEIVQEASMKEVEDDTEAIEYLRSLLIHISDASMDAVEVKYKDDPWSHGYNLDMTNGWNESLSASKDKRKEWTT